MYTNILRKVINKSQRLKNHEYICNAENSTKATWNIIDTNKYKQPKESIVEIIMKLSLIQKK